MSLRHLRVPLFVPGIIQLALNETQIEILLLQAVPGQIVLQPAEEFLRYLKGDGAIVGVNSSCYSFKLFFEYVREVVGQGLAPLLLRRPKPLVQRQRDGCAEVLLFFHSLLLSASPEASKA